MTVEQGKQNAPTRKPRTHTLNLVMLHRYVESAIARPSVFYEIIFQPEWEYKRQNLQPLRDDLLGGQQRFLQNTCGVEFP